MSTQEKTRLMEHAVTLDGKPARITGRLMDFAKVSQIADWWVSAEFCWATVQRIVEKGGAFKS